eukprot:CAMPEP_0179188818 /NCGR_PEP_ID=MMETSP0796-20121207/93723_1 /TAXON_ID=73915 /ORGANISM="Pyrodinium bahamense, Strain pbaha01" /LENGTH=187 /DNA_ID=CAMNT_0020892935 /DNA_START=75 /DNA_END=639 /DNA_ORIENTATION=+
MQGCAWLAFAAALVPSAVGGGGGQRRKETCAAKPDVAHASSRVQRHHMLTKLMATEGVVEDEVEALDCIDHDTHICQDVAQRGLCSRYLEQCPKSCRKDCQVPHRTSSQSPPSLARDGDKDEDDEDEDGEEAVTAGIMLTSGAHPFGETSYLTEGPSGAGSFPVLLMLHRAGGHGGSMMGTFQSAAA